MLDLNDDDEFLAELRGEFLRESEDLLEQNESNFLELEKNFDAEALENIFRLAHNLKGTAKAVGFEGLSHFSHEIENLLVDLRNETLSVNASIIDLLLACNDQLKLNIETLQENHSSQVDNSLLIEKLNNRHEVKDSGLEFSFPEDTLEKVPVSDPAQVEQKTEVNNAAIDSLRELGIELDSAFSEEASEDKTKESQATEPINEHTDKALEKVTSNVPTKVKQKDEIIKLSLSKIDNLLNHFGEQVILQSVLEHAKLDIIENEDLIQKTITQLSKITYDLQQTAITLRMVSVRNIFSKMERIVRDTGNSLGKKIKFIKY